MTNDSRRSGRTNRRPAMAWVVRASRPVATLLLIAGWLVTTVGFPVPNLAGRDLRTPYPCMERPCGCRDAVECWTSCQCFSPAERVAWALAKNVEIPDYAVLPSPADMEKLKAAHAQDTAGCCSKPKACCGEKAAGGTCCGGNAATVSPSKRGSRTVLGLFAAKCKGLDSLWLQVAAAPSVEVFFWRAVELVEVADVDVAPHRPTRSDEPVTPPPRFLSIS